MKKVEIYTRSNCSYCTRAKALLDHKEIDYLEISVDNAPQEVTTMQQRTQQRTYPQILINNKPIGGCDDLYALETTGKLNQLLTGD